MHVGKTKYVKAVLYEKLLGALLTMPLYDCTDQTLHTYEECSNLIHRIGKLTLHEKRLRQTTYSKIENYLEQLLADGKI